jgi:ribonuclease J
MDINEKQQVKKPYRKRTPFVKIFALGGLDEIGKNMYGIQYGREIVIIDCGIKFPGPDMPGIDYIIPNIRYLIEHKEMVKAIVLTHGHEDHIGGLPFVLQQLDVPVYGAALTIGFVRAKLEEHGLLKKVRLHAVDEHSQFSLDRLTIQFFRTHHSIPDSLGIVVQSPQGNIVHTGDFKFDLTPVDRPADWSRLAEVGRRGVLALLADSTNSERPGYTPSERTVGQSIRETLQHCRGRVLFATFASNVHRLQQVVEAAEETGRKIAVIGRSMERAFRIGQELGYIRPPAGMLIPATQIDRYQDQDIVIVCTGSQGEPSAALTRIATGAHKQVSIYPGDTVIFSASPIPGNTINVNRSIDRLLRAGAEVISGSILDIHASGHGCREDLKLMHAFMKPKYFMPIHGEHRMLVHHAQLAEDMGMKRKNIFVLDNGYTLQVSKRMARRGKVIPTGEVLVKGNAISEFESEAMEERKQLSGSGVMVVNVVVNSSLNLLLGGPDLVTRGFVYVRESSELINHAKLLLKRTMLGLLGKGSIDMKEWEQQIIETLSKFVEGGIGRSPLILPVVVDVAQKREVT